MQVERSIRAITLTVSVCAFLGAAPLAAEEVIQGERLDPSLYGPSYVESMQAAVARDALTLPPPESKERQGRNGDWVVPSRGATYSPHSGEHYAVNKWGDTRMGIGFGCLVHVDGAYLAGQAGHGAWTTGIRAIGYRDGQEVQRTEWFHDIGAEPRWFAMNLSRVDRIEIESVPVLRGGGWYGMDDLTYSVAAEAGDKPQPKIVVDFDDLPYRYKLTGSDYAELTWETGTGDFSEGQAVHAPIVPPGIQPGPPVEPPLGSLRSGGTLPALIDEFQGVIRGDAGSWSYPPDTDGAVGPNHYVETVNRNFAVYDKTTGAELVNMFLGSFLPGSNGDPRVLFDHHSGRWVVLVTDFSSGAHIYLAVSMTHDPTGSWFKTSFLTAPGSDAGTWPDYPTLGVDANGIYTAAYMVGAGMTVFAIDKAPLITASPSLGAVTAFRGLPWEGAIQPAHTYGTPSGEYLISVQDSNELRVRRVNPPLTSPTLSELGNAVVPFFSSAPDASALGSSTPLDTVDTRLMMSVYRDGSIWTSHTINVGGRAACRWYEINAATLAVIQSGTVADGSLHYFFPSIMVNQFGDVAMAFTGSSSSQYAACYYTGRRPFDLAGEMAPPALYKPGNGPQNNIDGYGRNRWGDYSYTTLDPIDQTTFYTIQEYGHATNIWGTYVGVLSQGPPDCNANDVPDECELDCGPVGGECDVPGCGEALDCNGNTIPDSCEWDCNDNGIPDDCDLSSGTSEDCNLNLQPDECDLTSGFSFDCNGNDTPDDCEQVALITGQPTDANVCPNDDVTFTVTAPAATGYQWYHDGGLIGGATFDSLMVFGAGAADEGTYTCVVSQGCIEATTAPADLTLAELPYQQVAPASLAECDGDRATFVVGFGGEGPLSYQWEKDAVPIAGATGTSYTIPVVSEADEGVYRCRATNLCASVYSDEATLVVDVAPIITKQPESQCADTGETAVFSVAAAGDGPFYYKWFKDDQNILQGQGLDTLSVTNVQPGDAGEYRATVQIVGAPDCQPSSEIATLDVDNCPACSHLVAGDLDDDGGVDLYDFSLFQACFGTGKALVFGCECANLDAGDNDINVSDFALWEAELTGP